MAETYSVHNKGFLLISSMFILTIMILIVSFYLSAVTQEVKVANIVDTAPQAYYLAEAGVADAMWKLGNDNTYITNFETNPSWSTSFVRNDTLIAGGSYDVSIENTGLAEATITATSTIAIADAFSQRVVRAGVFKALATTTTDGVTIFTNQELYGADSDLNVTGGSLHANKDLELELFSTWTTDEDAQAVEEVEVSVSSTLNAANIYDENNPPVPEEIELPQIDFDSSDPNSYKSLADQTYTNSEFSQLLKDFPVTTLNGITYVTGNVQIKKGTTLTINGALVSDGSVNIGNGQTGGAGPATLTINKVGNDPSGLLAKNNINVGGFDSDLDVAGLIYSGGDLRVQSNSQQDVFFDVTGGIVAQALKVLVDTQPVNITHNQTYINEAIGAPVFSPLLLIDHWEEEY